MAFVDAADGAVSEFHGTVMGSFVDGRIEKSRHGPEHPGGILLEMN